jgi:hypothetical protein
MSDLTRMDLDLPPTASPTTVLSAAHAYLAEQTVLANIYLLVLSRERYDHFRFAQVVSLNDDDYGTTSQSALDYLSHCLAPFNVRVVAGSAPTEGLFVSASLRPGEAITVQVGDNGSVRVAASAADLARLRLIAEAERAGILNRHEAEDRRELFAHKHKGDVLENPTDELVADAMAVALAAVRSADNAVKP